MFRVLRIVHGRQNCTQREIAVAAGCSLGTVNETINYLRMVNWLEPEQTPTARRTRREYRLTEHGIAEFNELRAELRLSLKLKFERMQKDVELLKRELDGD